LLSFLVWVEVLLESLPAFIVVLVHLLAGLLTPFGKCKTERTLKHECLKNVELNNHFRYMKVGLGH